MPFWTSYLLRIFAWKVILGFNGVINSGLKAAGPDRQAAGVPALQPDLGHHHAGPCLGAPTRVLPIYVSLEKIDRSYLEAATDLGDSKWKRFWRVTFPLSLPGTIAAILLVFIPTVGDYITPTLVGGTSGIMIGNSIVTQFGKASNAPLGAALSCIMMLAITLAVCAFLAIIGTQAPESARISDAMEYCSASIPICCRCSQSCYLPFLYVPVLLLPLFSFNDNIYVTLPLKGFTLKWYQNLLAQHRRSSRRCGPASRSASASPSSARSSACWRARAMTRYRLPGRRSIYGLIMLPLVIPYMVIGVSSLVILRRALGHRSHPMDGRPLACADHRAAFHAGPDGAHGRLRPEP